MREKFQLRLDGTAVTRATLREINTGARERGEIDSVWRAEVEAARSLDVGIASSQAGILHKILERGRVTVLSPKLEAQILRLTGDKTGLAALSAFAVQFVHQLQLLVLRLKCRFVVSGIEKQKVRLCRRLAKIALEDIRGLDRAVADLYGLSPLLEETGVEVATVTSGESGAEAVVRILPDTGDEEPPGVDLCFGQEKLQVCACPERPVKYLLEYIYGFPDFRPSQIDSIIRVLQGKDTIALLPTGSGKSIIFQMLAFIRPGFAIVVAPIVSLIDDQVDNLRRKGVDRVAGMTASSENKSAVMDKIRRGEIFMLYLAPERLQIKNFQEQLASLGRERKFSVLAIDEAHCVSEWGHDFRTSYLNLAQILRRIAPGAPLLALTGTASARILQEMCADLGMNTEAVQRPKNFDRPEIHFDVVRAKTKDKPKALRQILTELLPQKFGMSPTEFYKLQAEQTMSGIIFCPHVSGDYGVTTVKEMVKSVGLIATEYYGQAGKGGIAPGAWAAQKQDNAAQFKDNQIPLLVATKSFGMGVDKPNIRYIIHYCPSASIEAYYQEAGRGGRDRCTAWSFVIISNDREKRNHKLLSPDTSYEEFKRMFTGETGVIQKKVRKMVKKYQKSIAETLQIEEPEESRDDIDLLLYFHIHNFPGPEAELAEAEALLEKIRWISADSYNEFSGGEVSLQPDFFSAGSIEKTIYRLQKAGYLEGYTVDFAKNTYLLKTRVLDASAQSLAKEALRKEIELVYSETEPERRRSIGKIIEIMTTAGKMVEPAMRDDYLRKEVIAYLTSE